MPVKSDGVTFIGTTHLLVTSRQGAALEPTLTASVETTRPAPFTADLLTSIASNGKGGRGPVADTFPLVSGIGSLVGGLSEAKAALIAGALLDDVKPAYRSVAPGVMVRVTPSMSPDGSTADLNLETKFGVKTSALDSDKSRTDVWAQAEPDAVAEDHLTTHATVPGFTLFDISSFNLETVTPQGPDRIPILSRLPIFGPMFQFPRGSRRIRHESIILVNAALLPRALGLIGFYGGGRISHVDPPEALANDPETSVKDDSETAIKKGQAGKSTNDSTQDSFLQIMPPYKTNGSAL